MKSESERMMDVTDLIHATYGKLVTVSNHIQKLWDGEIIQTYSVNWISGNSNRLEFGSIDELELWASETNREILFRKFNEVIK